MKTTVTTPGVTITSSTPVTGCPTTGVGTPAVTYTCAAGSGGISAGTPIVQTYSGAAGPVAETITYNANGPITGFPAVPNFTIDTGNCTAPSNSLSTCGLQTSAATVPTGTFVLAVTAAAAQTAQVTSAPATVGTCPVSVAFPTAISTSGGFVLVPYTCSSTQSIPSGTNVSGVMVASDGILPPTMTASTNDNAPIAGVSNVPAPTTQTLNGSAGAPALAAINPSSGPSGTVVTISGTNLTGATAVMFGTAAATNVACIAAGTSCTATAPAVASGTTANVTAATPGGTSNGLAYLFTSGAAAAPGSGSAVTLSAGWNLVGGPAGTVVTGNAGPLYTYQAGDTNYETIPNGAPLRAGFGYWVSVSASATVTLPAVSGQTQLISLPPGQWIMVGNPGNTLATVSGADVVFTYSPASNYQAATSLAPGQGAWAMSTNGGTLTITNR